MGDSSFGGGQSFNSDNRDIKRWLTKAEKYARANPEQIKPVTDCIVKALTFDEKIQQNLAIKVEKLIQSNDTSTAKTYSNSAVRAISTTNKNEALYLGLSFPIEAIDDKVHRFLIEICVKLGYKNAAVNLVNCLTDGEEIEKKTKSLIPTIKSRSNKNAIIFEKLTSKHLKKITLNNEENAVISRKFEQFPPMVLPKLFWRHRSLLRGMISRDIRMKYHKSILGWIWAMMEPLALTLTFLLIYEIMATDPAPYRPLTIMIGLLFWSFFATTLKRGTVFLESNVRLIQKVSMPREIFLLSRCGFAVATLLINLLALIPFLYYYELIPTMQLFILPLLVIGISILALGISMFTSILHSKLRDTGQIVNVSTRVGFYFTPVFYTIDMIANSRIPAEYFSAYLVANPMAVYISLVRSSIMGTSIPISSEYVIVALIETVIIFILGSYYYQSKQDQAVKYL